MRLLRKKTRILIEIINAKIQATRGSISFLYDFCRVGIMYIA
jgi:hypothetical protein